MEPRAALAQAAEELSRQRAEIAALRREKSEAIAVIGMACRLPGAEHADAFWELLDRGGDAVTEVPRERWLANAFYDPDPSTPGMMATRQGAFIEHAAEFDASFFGIAAREARSLDPQQRLLLEVVWEALEHANIPPTALYGSATGVFVGITCFDHAIRLSQAPGTFDAYAGTGSALNMAPGRVSYVLGLTGPSMAVDTACSSSLVCLHLACQSLRTRESTVALVGGVHLILSPEVMVSFSQARMLAPDGRSKTFDASADGYGRGEGCGVVVLKRLTDALADGDTILGLIRGTAVNQDGPSGGLTVPNGASQQRVIRKALDAAGAAPTSIAYVEAHGTGTPLGDPIEVEALASVYGEGRVPGDPLLIGSAKTNIGHLEPAAGMAGLIKILLALDRERIPRHLHFRTPSPHIPWGDLPIRVVAEPVAWPRTQHPRRAGLSAFGFSGTNTHVIVEEAPARAAEPTTVRATVQLVPLSAKSRDALRDLAARYAAMLRQRPGANLASVAYTAGAGRAHFAYRLTVLASTTEEACASLEAFAAGGAPPSVRIGKAAAAGYRRDVREVAARLDLAYERLRQAAPADAADPTPLDDIATLYLEGVPIEWERMHEPGTSRRAPLPTYPFQRQRYWIEVGGEAAVPAAAVSALRYQLSWCQLGAWASLGQPPRDRRWAIVSPGDPLGDAVRDVLCRQSVPCDVVRRGDAAGRRATDILYIATARHPRDSGGACADLLELVHDVLATPGPTPRIWTVTRGATPVSGTLTIEGAAQAPLTAFARVLGLEHPELSGRSIDLDPATAGDAGEAERLLAEILCDESGDDQVALRGGARHAPRVDRDTARPEAAAPIRPDATYVITGGLGRLGLHAARWLAGRGARHLCLVGRTGASSSAGMAGVAALEAQGVHVRVAAGDVTDRVAMATLFGELRRDPPVRGIVHAAGRAGYADIAQLTRADLEAVVAPKIDGAWTIHELTSDVPLDFFVCFSSIASAWGSRGQAHYAAGNAFLDALAYHRRASGLAAVTINWGPWAGGGMTSPEAEALLRRVGVRPLAIDAALAALDGLAAGERPQPVVADVDWVLFRGSYEARGHRRLLEHLSPPAEAATRAGTRNELVRSLDAASVPERERLLGVAVQAELGQVLALPEGSHLDVEQGLFEMGIDSLMALELRTRLETLVGRALPATLVFECPTVLALTRFLRADLWPAPVAPDRPGAPPVAVATAPGPATFDDLDALSDDDAEALLLKKIESIL